MRVKTTAIIVAAGDSRRIGFDKIFADLRGKPVLAHSLEAFQSSVCIDEIVVVVKENRLDEAMLLCSDFPKVAVVVEGGADRASSVRCGLKAIDRSKEGIVAIHDGARPLITPTLINELVAAAKKDLAVIPVVPVKDTVKVLGDGGFVADTPDRESLFLAQTPQVFDLQIYCDAVKNVFGITDDSTLVERLGYDVRMIDGDYSNIKITTLEDLVIASLYLEMREKWN